MVIKQTYYLKVFPLFFKLAAMKSLARTISKLICFMNTHLHGSYVLLSAWPPCLAYTNNNNKKKKIQ